MFFRLYKWPVPEFVCSILKLAFLIIIQDQLTSKHFFKNVSLQNEFCLIFLNQVKSEIRNRRLMKDLIITELRARFQGLDITEKRQGKGRGVSLFRALDLRKSYSMYENTNKAYFRLSHTQLAFTGRKFIKNFVWISDFSWLSDFRVFENKNCLKII